ncbi:MAG: hypothetical protein ABI067_05695 [Leifsonia sp.]
MPTTLNPRIEAQLHDAVTLARDSRHQHDCACSQFRGQDGAGYCTPQEWRATQMLNRILGQIIRLNARKPWP